MRKHVMAILALALAGSSLGFAATRTPRRKHPMMPRGSALAVVLTVMLAAIALSQDQQLPPGKGLDIRVLAEKEVAALPEGPLFWRMETFPTLEAAEAAAGPLGLAAEAGGEVWLFTLHPQGVDEATILQAEGQPWREETPGGALIAGVGPLPEVVASSYLLRVNEATAVPGGSTVVHTHPGTKAFYALAGEISVRTAEGVMTAQAEQAMAGHAAGTAMQVFNGGSTELHELIMFVVDATQPFSSPAEFQ